jgi:hypothetical protein
VLGLGLASSVLAVGLERDAAACGGCFHPPTQVASDITDERMLLSVSTTQTTLYDQIRYAGSPSSFAWVLPIHGTVKVGLSADVLFGSVDVVTATRINPPEASCPPPPSDCAQRGGATSAPGYANGGGDVTVTKQENVGPYATVQLHATDSGALNDWLAQNGYNIPADVVPVIDQYVKEGFDFLAMKLLPNAGVQAMRPVRVTIPGASLSLPLRMAAIGTGASVGITIWVVSEGRYEPQNFPFFHIEDSALVWDWSISSSNYTTLRAKSEAALGGKGWEIESSLDLDKQLITNVVLSGGQYYGGGGYNGGGPISDPAQDYLPAGAPDGGGGESAEEVRTDDVTALFAGMTGPNVRITRMRGDISHAAMTTDFVLRASADQSQISNIRRVSASINQQCPIYDNCNVIGTGTPAQAAPASGSSSMGAGSLSGRAGCVASPRTSGGSSGWLAILGGSLALVAARIVRRRASRKG